MKEMIENIETIENMRWMEVPVVTKPVMNRWKRAKPTAKQQQQPPAKPWDPTAWDEYYSSLAEEQQRVNGEFWRLTALEAAAAAEKHKSDVSACNSPVVSDLFLRGKSDTRTGHSSGRIQTNSHSLDFWTSPEGQAKLSRMAKERDERHQPASKSKGLFIFEYSKETRASLCPMSSADTEWHEIELTADTGACDTVIPKSMCPGIPLTPSYQSLHGMEYEVASGESIPNLGEKRCEMWTEGATCAKSISMQVADVHKALLSLSRCADMGFESRFGARFGCLIDTETGEVIPLQRRGNLYMLKAWIRAAPFGRQEVTR